MSSMSAITSSPVQGLDLAHLKGLAGDDDVDLYGDNNPFKADVCYPVLFTDQSVSTTAKGLSLLKIKTQQIVPNGAKGLTASLTVTLPLFSPKAVDNYGSDKLKTMRDINAKLLDQILRATYPESFQGTVADAGKIVMGAARAILKGELAIKSKRCYYSRKRGKTGDRLFDNFSATPFDGLPLANS